MADPAAAIPSWSFGMSAGLLVVSIILLGTDQVSDASTVSPGYSTKLMELFQLLDVMVDRDRAILGPVINFDQPAERRHFRNPFFLQ